MVSDKLYFKYSLLHHVFCYYKYKGRNIMGFETLFNNICNESVEDEIRLPDISNSFSDIISVPM